MPKILKNIRPVSAIVLLIIGGIYIRIMLNNGDMYGSHCGFGDSRVMASMFFIPLYIVVLLASTIASIAAVIRGTRKFNFLPILVTIFLILLYKTIDYIETSPRFDSPDILTAQSRHHAFVGNSIELKQNRKFVVFAENGMEYCRLKGEYKLYGDTISFLKDINTLTDSAIYNTYYIDRPKGLLYPINKDGRIVGDSSKWMLIQKPQE